MDVRLKIDSTFFHSLVRNTATQNGKQSWVCVEIKMGKKKCQNMQSDFEIIWVWYLSFIFSFHSLVQTSVLRLFVVQFSSLCP